MSRYQQMESLGQFPPVQFLSSEASLVSDGVVIGDVHARQPLASTMPFNSEELGAIATGQFVHHQQRRPGGSQHHGQRREYTHTRNNSYNKHVGEEEEEEILWGAEPIQTGQLGTFDASGQFVATTKMTPPLKPIIPTSSLGTIASEPSAGNLSRTTKTLSDFSPAVPPGFGPVLPIITSSTQWVYRDPVGNLQGPFLNGKMLEWYQAGYFPDNLPIRRDTDSFFDTLSAWRLKCGGRVPFEATSPIDIGASANKMQEVKTDSGKALEDKEAVQPKAVDSKAKQTSESERFLAGLVTGKLDMSLGEEPKKAIPIEQLEAHIKPTVIKKDSPTILQRPMGAKETSEEAVQQSETKASKTFAGLMGRPSQEQEYKPLPVKKPSAAHTATESTKPKGEGEERASGAFQVSEGRAKAKEAEVQPGKKTESASQTQQWLHDILASTSNSLDIPTCTSLLMEMTCMDDVITFCQDNGIRTGSLTITRFSQELIARRFGQDVAAKQAKACTKKPSVIDDRDIQREREARGDDSEFVSAKRK